MTGICKTPDKRLLNHLKTQYFLVDGWFTTAIEKLYFYMKHFLLKCSTLPCGKCVCLAGSSPCLCWCLCVWSSSHFSNKDMWEFRSKTSTTRPQKCAQVVILFNTERREKHNEKHFGIRSVRAPVRYVRKEHLRLFLSFFLLLSPALEGESSLSLA